MGNALHQHVILSLPRQLCQGALDQLLAQAQSLRPLMLHLLLIEVARAVGQNVLHLWQKHSTALITSANADCSLVQYDVMIRITQTEFGRCLCSDITLPLTHDTGYHSMHKICLR